MLAEAASCIPDDSGSHGHECPERLGFAPMELELAIMLAATIGAIALVVAAVPRAKRLDGFAYLIELSRSLNARPSRHGPRTQQHRTRI